jgi:hypothetical protein
LADRPAIPEISEAYAVYPYANYRRIHQVSVAYKLHGVKIKLIRTNTNPPCLVYRLLHRIAANGIHIEIITMTPAIP